MAIPKVQPESDSRKPLTQERLKEVLHYDPETGVFTSLKWRGGVSQPGVVCGCVQPHGYVRISVDGKPYYAHRLAWFYMTGRWPTHTIDHINRDRADNKIANLREATHRQQRGNTRLRKDNKSGFKGVSFSCVMKKWHTQIGTRTVGFYTTKEEAAEAYRVAAIVEYGEFARVE